MIYLFSFLHTGTAFMVIVQFSGHLVRQYRACIIDSLGLGITCVLLISLYYVHKVSRSCLFAFYAIPIFFEEFLIYLSPLIFKLI